MSLWNQFEAGAITAEEAQKAADAIMAKFVTRAQDIKRAEADLTAERGRLAELQKTRAEAVAKAEADAAKEAMKAQIDAAKEAGKAKVDAAQAALAAAKKALDESLQDERKTVEEIKRLRGELTDTLASDADRLREIRRKGMTEAQQQADIEKQIAEQLAAARKAMDEGDTGTAKARAEEAKALAERLDNGKKSQKLFKESALVYAQAADAEIDAAERKHVAQVRAAEEAAKAEALAAKGADEAAKARDAEVAKLEAQLATLTADTTIVKIDADVSAAEDKIRALQAQLDRLNATPASRAGGGALPGYALGGPIPGYAVGGHPVTLRPGLIHGPGTGTSDSILARVSNGEHAFITKAGRAKQLWPLLNALNFGSDALVERVLSNLPGGLARASRPLALAGGYASGGPIAAQTTDTVNIHLSIGRQSVRLQGARDQADALAGALRELQRGL